MSSAGESPDRSATQDGDKARGSVGEEAVGISKSASDITSLEASPKSELKEKLLLVLEELLPSLVEHLTPWIHEQLVPALVVRLENAKSPDGEGAYPLHEENRPKKQSRVSQKRTDRQLNDRQPATATKVGKGKQHANPHRPQQTDSLPAMEQLLDAAAHHPDRLAELLDRPSSELLRLVKRLGIELPPEARRPEHAAELRSVIQRQLQRRLKRNHVFMSEETLNALKKEK